MLVDGSQAHLELSLNIIDVMSESFTRKKETSARAWAPHKTPAFMVCCLSLSVIPVSLSPPASSAERNKHLQCLPKDVKVLFLKY